MYDNDKDTVIRVRVPQKLKDDFQALCKSKAINSSELLRQLITQWIHEQQDTTIMHKRSSDI
jgi:antitoxin component of RelBE/YafQ-DinJ toxin-antitoxin module